MNSIKVSYEQYMDKYYGKRWFAMPDKAIERKVDIFARFTEERTNFTYLEIYKSVHRLHESKRMSDI